MRVMRRPISGASRSGSRPSKGQSAVDPQRCEAVHGRPGEKDEAGRVALRRLACFLAGDDRVAQDMEGAQPGLGWAGGCRVAVKHHAEIAERRDGEGHIGEPERLEACAGVIRRRRLCAAINSASSRVNTFLGDRRQEFTAIGEVVVGSAWTDARSRSQFAQAQRVDPVFGDCFDCGLDQRLTQASVMVVGLPFRSHGSRLSERTRTGRPGSAPFDKPAGHECGQESSEVWSRRIQSSPRPCGFERQAHQDVCGGERISSEPWPIAQLLLQIIEMQCYLAVDVSARRPAEHAKPADDELQQQGRHAESLRRNAANSDSANRDSPSCAGSNSLPYRSTR